MEVEIPYINLTPNWYIALNAAIVYVINDATVSVYSMTSQMNAIISQKNTC